MPPSVVIGSLKALELVAKGDELRAKLKQNAALFRELMDSAGFTLLTGQHPIIPVMFSSEIEAAAVAKGLHERGIHAVAFSYPVVPLGKARIRIQLSAQHSESDINQCVQAFMESARG